MSSIKINDLSKAVQEVVREYSDDVQDILMRLLRNTQQRLLRELKLEVLNKQESIKKAGKRKLTRQD